MSASDKTFIRIWEELPVEHIRNHLIIIDDLYGSCAKCKQLGLNYIKDKICTGCGTEFKYITTKLKNNSDSLQILKRIKKEGLALKLIDKDDYTKAVAHNAAKDLFKF